MTATQRYWKGRPLLYRVFDAGGRLIYVGQTKNAPARLAEHRGQSWWWKPLAAKVLIQLHPTVDSAKAAEKVAIQEERPVFNSMGYGNWREHPYWTDRDRELYYAWYRDMCFASMEPEKAQGLIDLAFPEKAAGCLWMDPQ